VPDLGGGIEQKMCGENHLAARKKEKARAQPGLVTLNALEN
jgi:hypothetical protein